MRRYLGKLYLIRTKIASTRKYKEIFQEEDFMNPIIKTK